MLRSYDDDIWEYLIENKSHAINSGSGFLIKPNTPIELKQKLREIQDEELDIGQPYWILDFLAEDFELDPDCIEYRDFCYYRKYKPKPKDDARESE